MLKQLHLISDVISFSYLKLGLYYGLLVDYCYVFLCNGDGRCYFQKVILLDTMDWSGYETDDHENPPVSHGQEAVDDVKYFDAKTVLKRCPKSIVWKFMKFKGSKSDGLKNTAEVYCELCRKSNSQLKDQPIPYRDTSTKNLLIHLDNHHQHDEEYVTEKLSEEPSTSAQRKGLNLITAFTVKNQNTVKKWPSNSPKALEARRIIVKWITSSLRPVLMIEDEGFIELLQFLCPEFTVPNRSTIQRYIDEIYIEKKDEIIEELSEVQYLAVTSDGGSSSNAVSFQNTNVHYINKEWQLVSTTLGVKENKGSADAEVYKENTDDILEEFNIQDKVVMTVTDNEPKMHAAFNDRGRSGCTAHIFHSSTSKGLKGVKVVDSTIKKMRKVAQKHNKSCVFRKFVRAEQVKADLKPRIIIQDIESRWGSTKASSDSYLNHRDDADKPRFSNLKAINSALIKLKDKARVRKEKDKIAELIFTEDEMLIVENLNSFLTKLDVFATKLGGSKFVTSSIVVPVLKGLQQHLEPSLNDVSYIAELKNVMLTDIRQRITDNVNLEVMFKATALDVRYKRLKMIPKNQRPSVYNNLKDEMQGLLLAQQLRASNEDRRDESNNKKQKLSDFYESESDEEEEDNNSVNREMERYLSEAEDREGDTLQFWRDREASYPLLSKLARKYLCIPATSVEAERRFSDLGILLTKRRLCMTGEHVDAQLFLRDKFRKVNV